MVKFDEEKQKKRLQELHIEEAESVAKILSEKYGVPYIDLTTVPINTDALRLVPEEEARAAKVAVFKIVGKQTHIAAHSPESERTISILNSLKGRGLIPLLYIVSDRSLERAWERYKEISYAKESEEGVFNISNELITNYVEKLKTIASVKLLIEDALKDKKKYQTTGLIETFVSGALGTEASDIHIEPEENNVRLRFRLDGVLQDVVFFEHVVYRLVNSRIKLISGLKLNVKEEAQDGRFSIKLKDIEIGVRTSVIPGAYGETIVMRLLNPDTIKIPFESLGIEEELLKVFEHEIEKPNGMILNTGPTGSGKTTTLYSFLRKVQTPGINIITIEDPIEYHLSGITQTQTNDDKGYTFLTGLRSSLRQDPDVIMVGEIRDKETAETAIHASLTGHLVLSTLHTNSAAGAIPRLIDLGVNPKIIGSALNLCIAQRLVRLLCSVCKKKDKPTGEEIKIIDSILKTIQREKITGPYEIWRPVGCDTCNGIGYKGRIGVFEAVLMDKEIEKLTTENPSEREIKQSASARQGLLDMRQDGILKVLRGVTTLEELGRVVDLGK